MCNPGVTKPDSMCELERLNRGRAEMISGAIDWECRIRGLVMIPPPTAGIVSYSVATVSRSRISLGDGENSGGAFSQSTTSNEVEASSKSIPSLGSDSSVKSTSPLLAVKRLLKPLNTLLVGNPSGRKP